MNEHKELYRIIRAFQTESGLSIEEIADAARIPDLILHECISEQSKLTIGTFASLALGFDKIAQASANQAELRRIYAQFVDEYLSSNPEQFDYFPNPHFKNTILRIGEKTQQNAIIQKLQRLLLPDAALAQQSLSEQLAYYWDLLNPDGQQEAVKHLYQLTCVPEYKK